MRPVKIFPPVETILKLDAAGLVAYKRLLSLQMINNATAYCTAIFPCVFMAICAFAAPQKTDSAQTEIQSVLQAQQDAWNRGDIDGFMNGYARSPSTVFISEDTIRRGWQTVRDRYKEKYSDREKMGTLMFSELEITSMSSGSAVASGRWRLKRANDEPHGRFTLILKRLPEGWRIVHDHSSAAPPSE